MPGLFSFPFLTAKTFTYVFAADESAFSYAIASLETFNPAANA